MFLLKHCWSIHFHLQKKAQKKRQKLVLHLNSKKEKEHPLLSTCCQFTWIFTIISMLIRCHFSQFYLGCILGNFTWNLHCKERKYFFEKEMNELKEYNNYVLWGFISLKVLNKVSCLLILERLGRRSWSPSSPSSCLSLGLPKENNNTGPISFNTLLVLASHQCQILTKCSGLRRGTKGNIIKTPLDPSARIHTQLLLLLPYWKSLLHALCSPPGSAVRWSLCKPRTGANGISHVLCSSQKWRPYSSQSSA